MNLEEQAKSYADRISIDFKKALEDANHIGYMAGENDMFYEMTSKTQRNMIRISFRREDLGISLWLVVPKEIYHQFSGIFSDFDERILDIILSQAGLPTYGDQLKDENIKDYERNDFEDQQRKLIEIFEESEMEVTEGGRPMNAEFFNEVWEKILISHDDHSVYDETLV